MLTFSPNISLMNIVQMIVSLLYELYSNVRVL